MSHLLAIGATGMLEGALRTLAYASDEVTLVARHATVFDLDNALPVDADWEDAQGFLTSINVGLFDRPPVTDALIWAHDAGDRAVMGVLMGLPEGARVVHVHGSADGDHAHRVGSWRAVCAERLRYTPVVLGRVRGGSSYRDLTHEEVCDGVLRAWRTERALTVGEVV
ncbi:MAG: hypothetical protein AAGH64_09085 [Planctomycetota bacterium]